MPKKITGSGGYADMTNERGVTLDDILQAVLQKPETLCPSEYQYYNGLKNRRIILNRDIDCDLVELAILPFIDMCNDGTGLPIEIILNCYGGEMYNGFAMISAIERAPVPVTIRIMGIAASMAMLIAMAGHNNPKVKVTCTPFSVGLIHSGSKYMEGSSNAVDDTQEFTKKYEKRIQEYILSHTKITPQKYGTIKRKEFWMDSEDMVKYGIVNEVV